jgi:TonB family protein
MTSTSLRCSVRTLSFVFLAAFASNASTSSAPATATPVDLDALADKLAPEIDKAGVKSVAVVDFAVADERPSELGWYLANKLSDSIILKSPATLVVDRMKLQRIDRVSSPVLPTDTDELKRIGKMVATDTVASGKIEITPTDYVLTVVLVKVSDGSTVASVTHHLPHSRILDLLSPAGDHASNKPARAGVMGVGVPVCLYCPIPADSRKWTNNQPENVILSVVISASGAAEKITVVRSPGYTLSEMAVEAVSGWRLRPAPGDDGKPTPVIVPIEVTFKSLRT